MPEYYEVAVKRSSAGSSDTAIVAAPAYLQAHGIPEAPEDLAVHNCIRFNFPRSERGWPFQREGQRFHVEARGNVEVDNGEAMAALAIAGHGIARIGRFHIEAALEAGKLIQLFEKFEAHELEDFHAIFIGGSNMPARVRAWIDFLAERLRTSA